MTNDTAKDVQTAFQEMAGAVKFGRLEKIAEYDRRIRAAREGKPEKEGDKEVDLLKDFKNFAKEDWTENFDIEEFKSRMSGEARNNSEAADTLVDLETINTESMTPEEIEEELGGHAKLVKDAPLHEKKELKVPEEIKNQIIGLANDIVLPGIDAEQGIVQQLRELDEEQRFPFVMSLLEDPQGLDLKAKQRVKNAFDLYLDSK